MTRNSDPIATRIADLADRRSALLRYFGPRTEVVIEYCLDGLSIEELAKRHKATVQQVDSLVRRRLEAGGRGAAGREFIRALGQEDAVACLEELALALDGSPICKHCRRGFPWNSAGRPAVYCGNACRQAAWRRRRAAPGYRPVEERPPAPAPMSAEERSDAEFRLRYSTVRFLAYADRRERGEHPALPGVRARRYRRARRPYRTWASDGTYLRLTIGRLYDWAYLEADVRSARATGRVREFYELDAYERAEEIATHIRTGEPGTWRELDLFPL